jgi:hypothetical protein
VTLSVNYRAYGVTIASSMPLPELSRSRDSTADLSVTLERGRIDETGWTWIQRGDGDDGSWLDVARRTGAHRLRFDSGGDFLVSDGGRRVAVYAGRSACQDTVRHLLIDQVIPLTLSHRGGVILHASAVALGIDAVAFVGPGGAGKSTVSASLCRHGARLVSDDALVVTLERGCLMAQPAYAGVRLWPDVADWVSAGGGRARRPVGAYTDKQRLGTPHGIELADTPVALRRIYLLADDEPRRPEIGRLSPRAALMALLSHAYVLDVADRDRLVAHFSRVSAACPAADVRQLSYKRSLDSLSSVRAAVLADISEG